MTHAGQTPGSIGRPVPNTECRIVELGTDEDVPTGEPGELWIRGPQVMKGYLNQPEATAHTINAEGWLRTGDVGRVDEDGAFWIVDRVKELIKYKGYQIAPAELEALLLTHPEIADAAVIPVQDEEAGEVPKAFVVGSVTRRRGHRVRRRARRPVQEAPRRRGHRRDPEVAVGQDPPPRAHRPRARGGRDEPGPRWRLGSCGCPVRPQRQHRDIVAQGRQGADRGVDQPLDGRLDRAARGGLAGGGGELVR